MIRVCDELNIYCITVKYDPVKRAFNLIRVIYDLEGDGEGRQGYTWSWWKLRPKYQDKSSNRHALLESINFTRGHYWPWDATNMKDSEVTNMEDMLGSPIWRTCPGHQYGGHVGVTNMEDMLGSQIWRTCWGHQCGGHWGQQYGGHVGVTSMEDIEVTNMEDMLGSPLCRHVRVTNMEDPLPQEVSRNAITTSWRTRRGFELVFWWRLVALKAVLFFCLVLFAFW